MSAKTNKKPVPVRILRFIGTVLLVIILLVVALFGFLALTEYKPADRETLDVSGGGSASLHSGDTFSVLTWNLGYCALGDNADFFMDGGSMVNTADKARVEQNLSGALDAIDALQPDVLLLQETDVHSTRSHNINEFVQIGSHYERFCASFANNFKVFFLPYPVPPIGRVDSGIATFSLFDVASAERVQLPIPFSWPVRMANLKRCAMLSRIPIADSDRELVLVNLHLEAYDSGEGKIAQTAMLAELLEDEAQKGNYVIAGGDFNQVFSSEKESSYPVQEGNWVPGELDVTQFSGEWQFLMDSSVPTCRSLRTPYTGADANTFQFYLIDGFIVSGNIAVESIATQDLGFVVSDHNPVLMRVTLR